VETVGVKKGDPNTSREQKGTERNILGKLTANVNCDHLGTTPPGKSKQLTTLTGKLVGNKKTRIKNSLPKRKKKVEVSPL